MRNRPILIRAPVWGAIYEKSISELNEDILIRAPVWGAIFGIFYLRFFYLILIRAPVWGAIHTKCSFLNSTVYFNPRTRVGCDLCLCLRSSH